LRVKAKIAGGRKEIFQSGVYGCVGRLGGKGDMEGRGGEYELHSSINQVTR